MTFKRWTNRSLAALGAFVAGFHIVANAPASIAASLIRAQIDGLTFESAGGTVWNGVLSETRLAGAPLGDIAFSVKGLSLLTGKAHADVSIEGGALTGRGAIALSPNGRLTLSDAVFEFDLSAARRFAFLGAPLTGSVRGTIRQIAFARAGCEAADVTLWTDVLAAPAQRLSSNAMDLEGEGLCADGSFHVSLAGEGAEGAIRLKLAVAPTMSYTLTATARPVRQDISQALRAFGFQDGDGALTIAMSGMIRTEGL